LCKAKTFARSSIPCPKTSIAVGKRQAIPGVTSAYL
jgi:hypothetical protein